MSLSNTPGSGAGPGNGDEGFNPGYGPSDNAPFDPTSQLFERGRPEDFGAIREILHANPSYENGLLIGWRLAHNLRAESADLACDLMKLSCFAATRSFVCELARLEHQRMRKGNPSLVEGSEFSSLRKKLVEFALGEGRHFEPLDRGLYSQEISDSTFAPISILRRTLDGELRSMIVDSVVRNSVAEQANRCGLGMLIAQERSSSAPVLSGEQVEAVATLLRDPLRSNFTLMQVGQLIDLWLVKEGSDEEPQFDLIRRQLVQDVYRYAFLGETFRSNEQRLYQSIRLVRHFNDRVSQGSLTEAANGSGTVPALLAALCSNSGSSSSFEEVMWRLAGKVPLAERRAALQVFGLSVSEELDRYMAGVLPLFFSDVALHEEKGRLSPADAYLDRLCIWHAIAARMHTQGLDSPLVQIALEATDDGQPLFKDLLFGVMVVLAEGETLLPVWCYDDPERLAVLHDYARGVHIAAIEAKVPSVSQEVAEQVSSFFCIRGPGVFGCPAPGLGELTL